MIIPIIQEKLGDERYHLHRYKATSHAAVVAGAMLGGWFGYQMLAHGQARWDLAVIMLAMVVTKLGALLWYRYRD